MKAANGPAILELHFSQPATRWEIDALNLTWSPPPTPTPLPAGIIQDIPPTQMIITVTPTPNAKPTRPRKK